jgi:hypothetical protein
LKREEKGRLALEGAETGESGVAQWQVQDHPKQVRPKLRSQL